MPLEKMTIRNLDANESATGSEVKVLFNPSEYSIEQSNSWESQNVQGKEPKTQFTRSDFKKLNLELFFDSYEEKTDVRQYTDRIARLMVITIDDDNNGKRPPIIEVNWGSLPEGQNLLNPDFPFKGVLLSLRQQFVMFSEQGIPVRAKLSLSIQEYLTSEEIEQRFPRRSSFPVKTYTVKEGDTISSVANLMWRKSGEWRRIATENKLQDPRALSPGEVLVIPAIK